MRRAEWVCGWLALLVFLTGAVSVRAQLTSDEVPRERTVPRGEQLRRQLEASRYHLGPFRIQPRFMVRDLGYNDNVFGATDENKVSDWTATAVGGVHWMLPVGPKMYVVGDALPEYTWYQKLSERRFFGGTYNASMILPLSRMSVEATGSRAKSLAIVSSELEAPAIRELNHAHLDAEVEIVERFSIFGRGAAETHRYQVDSTSEGALARVAELDRDETAVRGGFRYRPLSFFDVTVAAEHTTGEFLVNPQARDNVSDAILVGLHYDRPRVLFNVTAGQRKGKPRNLSTFPEYSTTTGAWYLRYSLGAPIDLEGYGHRRVTYGLETTNPYFFDTRNGVAVSGRIGYRVSVRAFGEVGDNDYPLVALPRATPVKRKDQVATIGGGLSVRLYRNSSFTVVVSQSEFDSNIDVNDRSVIRVQTGIVFRGDPTQ